jgi:glucose-1-phosphate adenylyltransferase
MEQYHPEYVLILSGDHIYKMDYKIMLDYHKANNADITIAAMPVPIEEASRFGVVVTDNDNKITEFEESLNIQRAILHQWVYTYSAGRFLRMHLSSLRISRNATSENT